MRSYVLGGGDSRPHLKDLSTTGGHAGRKKRLALAVGAWLLAGAFSVTPSAAAHPILDAAGAGVNITTDGNVMNITSSQPNNLIKWVDFSISGGKTVDFHDKNYLNYVTGSAVSDIQGILKGTGNIYLVNPNGILIGDGATVNVGSLYLSTKNLTADQLANYSTATGALFKNDNAAVGDVINLGNLNATAISVEGNNITFKNVANVKNAAGTAVNTNVTLTANSGGEIHIGSAAGEAATAVNDTQYKNVTLPTPEGWTINKAASDAMYMLVRNAYELQNMQNNLSGNYMLAKDIDAEPIAAFTPVGKGSNSKFMGKFDGLDYQVSNLKIFVDTTDDMAGLFGFNSGTIENLEVKGMTVTNNTSWYLYDVGAVAGFNKGTIRNVRNTGAIDCSEVAHGVEELGGIVGFNKGTIERAYNTGALTGNSDTRELSIGGIAGNNGESNQAAIKNSFNTGAITDKGSGTEKSSYLGGIVGHMERGRVENAYNSGALKSDSQKDGAAYLGGIVGYLNDGTVQHAYNSGTLEGKKVVGSISGTWGGVTDSYSTQEGNVNNGVKLTADNKMKQATYTGFQFTDTESQKAVWRIYDGSTMPLLTAFLTRKDNDKGTTTYNGTVTGDVGARYAATTYSGAELQIGGANYIKDVSIVKPKDLTVSFDASPDKIYDGTTNATAGTGTLTGKVEGDDVSLATGVTANYEDKNAGTNKQVNYTNVALTGDAAKNYNLTNAATVTGTGTITPKDISATFADVSKVYDGTTDATAGTATLTGVITGDTVNVSGTAAFADRNAGTNKTVNYTGVTLSGTDAANYAIADTATGTGTIDKANLTITSDPVTKTYDGTKDAMGVANIASGTLYDGDIISGGTFTFTDKNAGTNKTVTVSNVTVIDGNNGGNYNVTYEANTASTINQKEAQVTFDPTTKTYDGTTSATPGKATFWYLFEADKGKVGVTADAAYTDKNVGTGKKVKYTNVTLTGTEAQNYYLSETSFDVLTGTITRKALSLVATPQTITEGEATPTEWSGSVTGFVTGEGLDANDTLSFALDNPAAAAVGSYKVTGTLNGNESGNYGANYTFANAAANDTAFTIAAKSMTPQEIVADHVDASGAAQEYTGTITALESTARDENQTAPPQEKLAAGTTATHASHLTIENGGVNTPPNMDVAAALAAEAIAERSTEEDEEEEA